MVIWVKLLELISLGMILLGIVLFIMGGMIEVNATEEDDRMDRDNHRDDRKWDSSKEARKIIDEGMFASWLKEFSQVLVFAGIGFILYEIAHKSK